MLADKVIYIASNLNQYTNVGAKELRYGLNGNLAFDGETTYTYDDEGNTVKKSKGASDETWNYTYDHRNQMTGVEKRATDGGTLQMKATYVYDALGNRIEKSVDAENFFWPIAATMSASGMCWM